LAPTTFKVWFLALILSGAVRALYATLRVRVQEEARFETLRQEHGGVLLVTWHGQSLLPIARSRGRGYFGMVSLSRDGDLLTEYFRRMEWRVIRGSTKRGGAPAARVAVKTLCTPGTVLAITPDGPRGPARKVQPGVVFLARKSGKPLIPVGISVSRSWHARSWDSFSVPKPFARVEWLFGEPIFVGPDDDSDAVCQRVEDAINQLEAEAREALETESRFSQKQRKVPSR
jgi:lysophospholipid acyltransferase (LPLAT)-like uncharacterized protein